MPNQYMRALTADNVPNPNCHVVGSRDADVTMRCHSTHSCRMTLKTVEVVTVLLRRYPNRQWRVAHLRHRPDSQCRVSGSSHNHRARGRVLPSSWVEVWFDDLHTPHGRGVTLKNVGNSQVVEIPHSDGTICTSADKRVLREL